MTFVIIWFHFKARKCFHNSRSRNHWSFWFCCTKLCINIVKKLNFNGHILTMLKKGIQKLHALARISKYLSQDKLKIIVNTFIQSQINYCPLIWMFHCRTINNKINKLHERALRLVYKNDKLTFHELLQLDGSDNPPKKSTKTCQGNVQGKKSYFTSTNARII